MRSEPKCITGKPCSLKICVSIWSEDDTQTTLHIYSIRRENGTQNTSRPQQNSRYMPTRKLKHTSENYNSKLNTKQAMTKSALHANNWALHHGHLWVEWFTYSIRVVSNIYISNQAWQHFLVLNPTNIHRVSTNRQRCLRANCWRPI